MKILQEGCLSKQAALLIFLLAWGISGCVKPAPIVTSPTSTPAPSSEQLEVETPDLMICSIKTPNAGETAIYQFNFDEQGTIALKDGKITPLSHIELSEQTKIGLVIDKQPIPVSKSELPPSVPNDAFDENGKIVFQLVSVLDGPNSPMTGWANKKFLDCSETQTK
jgi:hypothetical protein